MTGLLIKVPVSAGELLDKISILQIKAERISERAKAEHVLRELELLLSLQAQVIASSSMLDDLCSKIRSINEQLWGIEDELRDCERRKDFGERFVELARAVYVTNDRRAAVKRVINELLGSELVEEKSYAAY